MSPAEDPPEPAGDTTSATAAAPPADGPDEEPAAGRLSRVQRGIVGLAALAMACAVVGHFGATFFHVAPQNVIRDEYGAAIRGYLYPEFRQGWSLFAPNLPSSDISVHARVQYRTPDGGSDMTEWVDLTAVDHGEMRHNPLPSRSRHQLRKGWTDVQRYQTENGQVTGERGADVRVMVTRIALQRVAIPDGARPEQVQFRSVTTAIPPPPWQPRYPSEPAVRDYDWWPVTEARLAGGEDR